MADEQFILTPAGKQRLEEELADLQALRQRATEELDDVDEDTGNLEGEEAGAFFDAKTRLERIDERSGHIRFVLDRAVVPEDDPNPKRVDPGERVVVWDVVERSEKTYELLSSPEVHITYTDDGRRRVSVDSPVGQAFLGRRVGDTVEIEVPDGTRRFTIRRIERIGE